MPNNDYANEPNQSRSEEIIQSILDNTEYDEAARSRIEYLLIELKNAIEGGGGGGGVTSYSPLTEKPKIDNHTLQAGNNTSSDLGLQTKLTFDSTPTESSTNPVTSGGIYTALGTKANSSDVYNKSTVDTALGAKADKSTTYTKTEVDTALSSKQNTISDLSTIRSGAALGSTSVQPVSGKGLSTNDYTTAEKEKLAGIEAQANKTTVDSALSESSTNPVQNKVVKSALDGKQATLTTAQLAAVNSGITSTDVEQIETNKNNISYNTNNGVKNRFDFDTWSQNITVKSGTKTVSGNSITITATANDCFTAWRANEYPVNARIPVSAGETVVFTWNTNAVQSKGQVFLFSEGDTTDYVSVDATAKIITHTIPSGVTFITIRFGVVTSGDIITYSDIMVRSSFVQDPTYQPYALSNAAITPALKECVDNGVKNLLDFSGSTPIAPPNCTMTNNGDGTYTVTKTSENLDIPYIAAQLKAGTYIYSGCPAGGSDSTYRLDIRTSTGSVVGEGDYGSGVKVTIPSDGWYRITCRLNSTYTTTGLTIKPMLCDPALWAISPTFEPHAMSNAELTAKEQTNENNISSVADQSTKYNILPVTLNSGTISDVTFTVNADKSISTSGTASSNITNAYINISFTLPTSGEYVLCGCASGGSSASTGSYRLDMLDGGISGTQVVADTGSGAVFTPSQFQNTTACVRLRIGNGANMNGKTFKPMIIPKAIYDAGFTDYQPYALPNTVLTPALADTVDNIGKNKFDISLLNIGINAVINTTTGTVTQGSEDTKTNLQFAFKSLSGSTIISDLAPLTTIQTNGVYAFEFTKVSTFDTIRFGHNGSSMDFNVKYPVSNLINGKNYVLQLNILNCVQANGKYSFNQIMLCDAELWKVSQNYQSYAMSNAEITAWILAHS